MEGVRGIAVCVVVAACGFQVKAQGDASTDSTIPGDTTTDVPGCPIGYSPLANAPATSKYRVVGGSMSAPEPGRTTWAGAELDCRNDGTGTHLAVPETMAEEQAFADVLSGASRWLGVTDRKTEGTWIPIIGGTTWYANWSGGTPAGDDCLLLARTTGHEAMPCISASSQYDKGFICECDGNAVDPTSF